jgi:hypothetical protein
VFTAGVKQILARNEGEEREREMERDRQGGKKGYKLQNDWSYSALGSHYSCGMETVITLMGARRSKVG